MHTTLVQRGEEWLSSFPLHVQMFRMMGWTPPLYIHTSTIDKIDEYHIIKQDIKEGTKVSKIDKLTVTVSNGIDPTKRTDITNMVGWKLDDVIKYIDNNHLTNVTINFEFSNTIEKDIIISQDIIKEISRNEPITLVSSLGRESDLKDVKLDNIVGLDLFHALVYLGRNNIKYQIEYAYSDTKKEGTVLKQSLKKWTIIKANSKEEIVITIAKENQVTVPNLLNMTQVEITEWATSNKIKVDFTEEYDDTIKEGKVLRASYSKGSQIETGTLIEVVLSKGQLKMIEFTDIDTFRQWALDNEINYTVEYQFSDTVTKGKLIYISHSKGQIVKNSESIKLIISDGGNTKIPDLIGLSKSEAEKKCKSASITCKFIESGSKVIKQSMLKYSNVPIGTTINVTLVE